jgi:DNA repair protein RadC
MAVTHSNASDFATPPKRRGRPPKSVTRPKEQHQLPSCIQRLEPDARRAIERAIKVLEDSAVYRTEAMSNPGAVSLYLKMKLAGLEHEEFHVLWLDSQNRLIAFDAMFTGTLNQTSVYPREVLKAALAHNAAACILAHNHPSGVSTPSRADELLTRSLKEALAVVDVKLLDHFIVAGTLPPLSFAEQGLL